MSVVPSLDLVLRGNRVVFGDGIRAAAVGVRAGRIVAIEPRESALPAKRIVELGDNEVLLPGLVDSHVHVNAPGREEWEGFPSATAAAAAGGITVVVDMPLNSIPPTVDLPALDVKRKVANRRTYVDVGFWGGVVPDNAAKLASLWEHGVFGFKCFTVESGVEEFPALPPAATLAAMETLNALGALLIVHAEDPQILAQAPAAHGAIYSAFVESRPASAETRAIELIVDLAARTGCRVHIVHVSSADSLETIASAKARGVRITAETCPHYLTFIAENVPDGATEYKCCPPIRYKSNRELLWDGLRDGTIDFVVSDHSPSTADLKCPDTGDFALAWGGISSLQLGLPVMWTEASARGFGLDDVVRWMSSTPAEFLGLAHKGGFKVGGDADFCIFAADETFVVDPSDLHHKVPITPYAGRRLRGVVKSTWLRGELITLTEPPRGRLIERGAS